MVVFQVIHVVSSNIALYTRNPTTPIQEQCSACSVEVRTRALGGYTCRQRQFYTQQIKSKLITTAALDFGRGALH
jgi:hypothetical protein